jgi:hypothetical protein
MKILLVWVLATYNYYGGTQYSPPVEDLASCQRMQEVYMRGTTGIANRSVQIRMVVPQ